VNTLYFEKLSQFDRVAEPVTVSVPLAQGALCDPQCLVVRDGTGYVAFRGRVTAYAGKSYIEVEHQFIHGEEEEELTLEGLELRFVPGGAGEVALGEGYYQTAVQKGAGVSMLLDAETMLYQANEHFIDSFYGDFWVDWRNERGGLTCSIHQAHQNFPKRLAADETRTR